MAASIATGAPLDQLSIPVGGPRIDDVLRRAAETQPDRTALRWSDGQLSYAELDGQVSRCAAALTALAEPGAVIALAGELSTAFALGYFGIGRARMVSAIVNPFLTADRTAHVLNTSGARVAIVSPQMYPKIMEVRDRLFDLETIVVTRADPELAPGVLSLAELLDSADGDLELPAGTADEAFEVACLQFTSGTTGAAKAAQLSHYNIAVNAAQTAHAHELEPSSVLFNFIPTFHLMHLTIAVHAAATLVLWSDRDVAGAVEAADRLRATHFYSLPVRLAALAADPKLRYLEAPSLRAILAGGSTLAAPVAKVLQSHFGVPVVQGYGLAEASPSMHLGELRRSKLGSCGPVVLGAQTRIVQVDSRQVVPVGDRGEIQVRGPQLMQGYRGHAQGQDFEDDGWFSTGDIGVLDSDGYLSVVDRLKDAFKCDNWLVSPTEIERVLLRHPDVADCVVFDRPHETRGATAFAVVVGTGPDVDGAAVAAWANELLAYYEKVEDLEVVGSIARSATGKVERRSIRDQYLQAVV